MLLLFNFIEFLNAYFFEQLLIPEPRRGSKSTAVNEAGAVSARSELCDIFGLFTMGYQGSLVAQG